MNILIYNVDLPYLTGTTVVCDWVFTLITKFIDAYRCQNWDKSKIILETISDSNENCQIFCLEFSKRIEYLITTNLNSSWDGVYDALSK